MAEHPDAGLERLLARSAIQDALSRYARAIDRGDWEALWSVYHRDAHDDHVEYRGDVDGLIAWLTDRFAGADNSMHFLGNCLIEFADRGVALVETYFMSIRLRPPLREERPGLAPGDAMCRVSCGRYVDRFERRDGAWGIARRRVVLDARFTSVAKGGARDGGDHWGRRDGSDPLHMARAALFGDGGSQTDI